MRWVEDENDFKRIFLEARTCAYIDSGRQPSSLLRLVFDDSMTVTSRFAELLQDLMARADEKACTYVVLDPDPVHYFFRHFNKYPVVEIARGDGAKDYLRFLNEDPGGSPADAIGTNCWAWVVLSPSLRWFVHALRSSEDNGGHLWIPPEWCLYIREKYHWLR